jgi:hypothetical protein
MPTNTLHNKTPEQSAKTLMELPLVNFKDL